MNKLKILIIILMLIILSACDNLHFTSNMETDKIVTVDIKKSLLDADFRSNNDFETFTNNYSFQEVSYSIVSYNELENHLLNIEYIYVNVDLLTINNDCENIYCDIIIITIFEYWEFDDITIDYDVVEKNANIKISLNISNFPMSTIKILVLQVDSSIELTYIITT